jgi:very-short-patch-repair endonuclease
MAPGARIPFVLKLGPFTLEEARAAGVSAKSLRGKSWRRLSHGLYCWVGLALDPWRLLCAWQRLMPETVFAGGTSAWLHGIDSNPIRPIEVIAPLSSGIRSRPGLEVRRTILVPADIVRRRGLTTTSILRTLSDLRPRRPGVEALVLIDEALHKKRIDRTALSEAASVCLRALAPFAEPAESPMETRLRWLLIKAGLPRPQVQAPIPEAHARADLYYPAARLVIEYDGGNHRDRMVEDNRRQNLLMNAGYRVLRFTASDIHNRPDMVVAQVSAAAAAFATRPAGVRR